MDFVQTMKDWRRMCDTIQSENQKTSSNGWCKGCPVQGVCVIDTEIKDTTEKGFAMIGERIQSWAAEHPEPVYPTWREYIEDYTGILMIDVIDDPIPADIAEKLGLQPKEGV